MVHINSDSRAVGITNRASKLISKYEGDFTGGLHTLGFNDESTGTSWDNYVHLFRQLWQATQICHTSSLIPTQKQLQAPCIGPRIQTNDSDQFDYNESLWQPL